MILSFLEPFKMRGEKAPYLWVFYKQLQDFGIDDVLYVASEDYFLNPSIFQKDNRWEFLQNVQKNNKYNIPSYKKIILSKKEIIEDKVYDELKIKFNDNISIWQFLLINRYKPLEKKLEEIIKKYDIEFIVSWSNNGSLKYIANKYNIPIIHNEKGPLREPLYYSTAYFDFSGVNGNTESKRRFDLFDLDELLGIDDLRSLFVKTKDNLALDLEDIKYDIGVALQVEDDSNLIAYNNGYDSLKLLTEINYYYNKNKILIRNHPLSSIKLSTEKYGKIDLSNDSLEFIGKCKKIATINSSIGFEGLFWGKEVCSKGDSPYYFFTLHKCNEDNNVYYKKFLNFFLINYLIPYDYLFDKEYYKWRINVKDEKEIFKRHEAFWLFKNNISLDNSVLSKKIYKISIEKKNGEINKLLSAIEEKNSKLKEYQSAIEEKNSKLKEYQSAIEEKNSKLKEYQSAIEEKNSKLKELKDQLNEYIKLNREYKKIIDNKNNKINFLKKNNKELLNEVIMYSTSKSWKWMKIFRLGKKILRKIK